MTDSITTAPHGINLVVELNTGSVVIGRFDRIDGSEVVMHHVDVWDTSLKSDREHWIRDTATYGVDVKQTDMMFPSGEVERWTPLIEIEKLAKG